MAGQEYTVRLSAETKQAKDKIDAVQNSLNNLTKNEQVIRVGVDAASIRRGVEQTEQIANNIRRTSEDIKSSSGLNVVSGASLSSAASLASQFYGIRRDVRGLGDDLGKALGKTNVSEFMRTEQFLERVLENSRSRSREIVETYANVRELPGVAAAVGPIENFARAKAWESFGGQIAESTLAGVKNGLQQGVVETKRFFYGEVLEDIVKGTSGAIDTLARLGLAIQGVQLLLGPLASAWGAAFNQIIGQNVRLQEVILSTQTTLASTGRVVNNSTGQELVDPLEKITALEGDVKEAIQNIRVRSLDLAGVTSQQIIDIFGVVATSISQVNGNIKDAEDLAISFTAALGTLGIPFYQARQEIGSILGGYITEDSLLAKRLQISNADISKARNSIDGVVGYLQKKLQVAVAGQAISAKSFSGVLSNIQEVFENIGQRIGEPLLGPIVKGLTAVYEFLKQIQGVVTEVGSYLSRTIVSVIVGLVNIFKQSTLVKSIGAGIAEVTRPFREVAKAIELGLQGPGLSVLDSWVNGLSAIPRALSGMVNALVKLGNFIKLQLSLITEPVIQLLDQSRDKLQGVAGAVQGIARMPQFLFFEGPDAFTKGWDTIASTIQYAATSLSKFALAIVQLKITEFTAKLRAAATVFELFGSLVLGKLNLAISFFDFLGDVASSDVAKLTASFLAINKLLNNTEFFGLKGLIVFLAQSRPIFQRFVADIGLFIKGFKDAGNIDSYVKQMQEAQQKLTAAQTASSNPVVANTAKIRVLTKELSDLRTAQIAAVKTGADIALIEKQAEAIKKVNTNLREATVAQKQFSAASRANAVVQLAVGTRETAAAQEALREIGVVTSGAAARQALSSAFDTLGAKIGLTREQMKGLSGAFNVATKSVRTFITTSLLINLSFTAAALIISGVMSVMQQLEEAEKKRQIEAQRTAQVNRILSSSYEGLRKAAAGGDIAAQRRLQEDQEAANAAFQIQQEKKAKLLEEDAKLNDILFNNKAELAKLKKDPTSFTPGLFSQGSVYTDSSSEYLTRVAQLNQNIESTEKARLDQKRKIAQIDEKIYRISLAQAKVSEVENQQSNFSVLAERRKDIEQKIQDVRKDYQKELSDKEFQTRMEVLNLEQQKRREIQEQELNALRERFSLLSNNATQQDQKIIALVQNYEQALLEAANAEADRRSELFIKEAQLKKEVEDYAYKMAKERTNLEKQIGNYQKEIEKWKTRQVQIRNREEIAALKQRRAIEAETYGPYSPETQQQFINAANNSSLKKQGFNVPQIYALFQLFSKKMLGITSDEPAQSAIVKLENGIANFNNGEVPNSFKEIAQSLGYTAAQADKMASSFTQAGIQALNLNRYVVKQDPNELRVPNLNIDWSGMTDNTRQFNNSLLETTRSLQELQRTNDQNKIKEQANRFLDPSNYTDIRSNYQSDLELSRVALENAYRDIQSPTGRPTLDSELAIIDQTVENSVRTVLRTLTPALNKSAVDSIWKSIVNNNADSFYDVTKKNNIDSATVEKLFVLLTGIVRGRSGALSNATNTYADRQSINSNTQLTTAVTNIATRQLESFSSYYQSALSRFNEALSQTTDSTYSLTKAQTEASREASFFVASEIAKLQGSFSEADINRIKLAGKALEETLLKQVSAFDNFNVVMQEYTFRLGLAQKASEIIVSATRTLFTDLQQSVQEGKAGIARAFSTFASNISSSIAQSFGESLLESYRQQLFDQFKQMFGLPEIEDKAKAALMQAGGNLTTAADAHKAAASALSSAAVDISVASRGGPQPGSSSAIATNSSTTPATAASGAAATDAEKPPIDKPLKETGKMLSDFGRVVSQTIPVIAGFGSIFAGITQTGQGGTYNVLSGLSSVFLGLSSITSIFTPGGLFGLGGLFGARASGGPVLARQPYLVGERGPELFLPESDGRVVSSSQTSGMFQRTRAALAAQQSTETSPQTPSSVTRPSPIEVRYEARVINNVEYVTVEQHRKGMLEAARRGQMMAYQGMQHSVKVRRRLGL